MGAWGYGVYSNDSALDFVWNLSDYSIPELIASALADGEEEKLRVAGDVFVQTYNLLDMAISDENWLKQTKADLIEAIQNILDDNEWIEQWGDTKLIRDNLNIELRALERL